MDKAKGYDMDEQKKMFVLILHRKDRIAIMGGQFANARELYEFVRERNPKLGLVAIQNHRPEKRDHLMYSEAISIPLWATSI